MRTIALFGAAGRTGSRVLDRLVEQGDAVNALVRDAARIAPRAHLAVHQGDARDRAAVDRVVAGAQAAISCLGMRDISRPSTDFSDSVRTMVDASRAAGVRRVIAIASALVLPHRDGGLRADHGVPAAFANVAAEHVRNYRTLRDSGLDWTIMCPIDLKEDIAPGRVRLAYDGLPPGTETGYDDLARTIVALIDDRASFGHRIGIVSGNG